MERRSHAAITEALANTWAADLVTQQATIDGRQTIRPPADTLDEQLLPPLRIGGKDAELELRERLGEGGMGVVERAWQRSIGRDVAIKLARDAKDSTRTTMVREARIAGSLEHPNIVPIHALGQDEHGQAVIVMKRVSGVSWRALLHSPEHALTGEGGRLLRSLEIMVQVCRALELAHSRGWLHRDL